jgi:hypothetical protein
MNGYAADLSTILALTHEAHNKKEDAALTHGAHNKEREDLSSAPDVRPEI